MTPLAAMNAESPTAEKPVDCAVATRATSNGNLPGLFLMIDSLQTGGSERQFVTLSRALNLAGHRVHLGCIQNTGPLLDSVGTEIQHFPLGGSMYGLQSWKTRLDLVRYLRRNQTAIAHAFDFYTNLTLIPPARLAGIPVVIGSHRQIGDLLTPMQFRAQLMVFHQCDAVVCNSSAAAERLIDGGLNENKITIIWNGLAPEFFAEEAPALPTPPGWKRVGMIARMNGKVKNHSLFLRVAARVKTIHPKVEFVLIGDGPLRQELEREAASLGLGDNVRFLGDRQDIPAVLASLDLSVLPSNSESLSNSVIESMAAGVPVIATEVGSNPELLAEDRGALIPVGDEKALAAALVGLLQDDNLRLRMAQSCRSFAISNFTIDQMRSRYEALYTQLLSRKDVTHSA